MVSTRQGQSNRRLTGQLDDFDQDIILRNATRQSQGNNVVNEGINDLDFTVGTSNNNSAINETAMNMRTLQRCFNERIDIEMSIIVDTVEDREFDDVKTSNSSKHRKFENVEHLYHCYLKN